jgi:adenylate cyclase
MDGEGGLERAMVRSDLLRAALLGGALVAMFGGHVVVSLFMPSALPPAVRAHLAALGALIGTAAAYEAACYVYLRRLVARGRALPPGLRYLNAVVEVSLPTVGILVLAGDIDGLVLLHGPTPYMYFLLILLATLHLDAGVCVWTGALAALEYGALAVRYLGARAPVELDPLLANPAVHLGKAAMIALAGALAAFVAHQLRRRFGEALAAAEARRRVAAVFGQHVSPAVAERLLAAGGDAGDELRRVCVMFLDVRGFTAFASGRPPAEVMAYLNTLFGAMIETVNRHQGIINKFLGDGFMAVFGAPLADRDACRRAVDAALDIVGQLDAMIAAGRIAPTRIGIGLHAGDVMTGTVGSPLRKEYTVIGDAVNLSSRIEGLTKQLDARVLASEAVWRELAAPPAGAASLGAVAVKGVAEPVVVYRIA